MGKSRIKEMLLDTAVILAGTFIFAAGLYFFIEPQHMAPGASGQPEAPGLLIPGRQSDFFA